MVTIAGGSFYEILEIPSDADEKEIKRAYHRMARDLHPDKASNPEEARQWEERFSQVSAAYNTLKDPGKRAEYDRALAKSKPSGGIGAGPAASPTAAVLSAGRTQPVQKPAAKPNPGGMAQQQVNMGLTQERIAIANKAYAKGMQYYKTSDWVKAIEFFEAAIKNNDTEPNYHSRLAVALIKARKSATRAMEEALRAIELDPYNLEHKFNLGYVYETIGSKSNAQKTYEDILRWDKDNERAKICLACLNEKKRGFTLGGNGKSAFLDSILARFKRS